MYEQHGLLRMQIAAAAVGMVGSRVLPAPAGTAQRPCVDSFAMAGHLTFFCPSLMGLLDPNSMDDDDGKDEDWDDDDELDDFNGQHCRL